MTATTKTSKTKSKEVNKKTTASSQKEEKSNQNKGKEKGKDANTELIVQSMGPDPEVVKGWSRQDRDIYMFFTEKKISSFDENDDNTLGRGMVVLQKFLGIKGDKILSGEAEDRMLEFISDYFGDFSIGEIQHAFNLASAEMLEGLNYDKNENHHFMEFGAPYIGRILRCYQRLRSKIIVKYQQRQTELLQKPEKEPVKETRTERYKVLKDLSLSCWHSHTLLSPCAGQDKVYVFLTQIGLINHTPELLSKAREGALINIRATQMANEGRGSIAKIEELIMRATPQAEQMKSRILTETYRVALTKFFNDLQDTAMSLPELFTNELEASLKLVKDPENTP